MKSLQPIQNISFVGSGNVASHLAKAFKNKGLTIKEVFAPNTGHALDFSRMIGCGAINHLDDLNPDVDLVIITVPDDKIKEVASQLPLVTGVVAHTSGFTDINTLAGLKKHGVFYPLQTFTKSKHLDLGNIPVCIEAGDDETFNKLSDLASKISNRIVPMNSVDRRYIHLAAVMVNNFTNYIYQAAFEVLDSKQIDPDLLFPLIMETAEKIASLRPEKAQTGPAKRNDELTIEKHQEMLVQWPEYREMYSMLSAQIKRKYNG